MNFRVLEPSETVSDERLGILYLNQGFSSIEHDAGRDAEILSNRFGLQVIAANRPGSGKLFSRSNVLARSITENYIEVMKGLAEELEPEVDTLNFDRLIVTGRSAGGLGAIALTCTEVLPVKYVYAAEPVGWSNIADVKIGEKTFKAYNKEQDKRLDTDDPELVRPEDPDVTGITLLKRNISIPFLYSTEKFHNKGVWRGSTAARLAKKIAEQQPEVDTTIEFADFSLVAPEEEEQVSELIFSIPKLRLSGAPFAINRVPHTVHASFDLRSFFGDRLAPIVERAKVAKTRR